MEDRLPNLVIAGIGKAGTTSLFYYLSQHPDICASDVKEVRYFEPITFGRAVTAPLSEYAAHFSGCGVQRYRMEASPQYFHGGPPLIDRLRRSLPNPRVIVILRDPVERIWSTYRFATNRLGPIPKGMTFPVYIEECRRVQRTNAPLTSENRSFWILRGSHYVEFVTQWLDAFGDDIRIEFFENLVADPPGDVAAVARWLEIDPTVVPGFDFAVENKTVPYRSRTLQRVALKLNSERLLRNRRWLKRPLRAAFYRVNRGTAAEVFPADLRAELEAEFAASNAALGEELRRRGATNLPSWTFRSAA